MTDATLITSLVLGFGLLARVVLAVHRENAALRKARTRTAAILRRVRQQRDHHADALCDLEEENVSLAETCCELQVELDEYRKEDARREAEREAGRVWLN